MAQRISVLVALDGADEGLKRALTSAEKSLGELASSAKTAGEKATAGMAEVKAGMSAFGDQVSTAKTQLLAFLSISWATGKLQEIVQVADAWNMMTARLKLATAGQREFTVAQKELFDIAQRIGVPISETATLYGKLQQAVRMLGGEQKEALTITESISQALRISGASADESKSALLQFGQALASGVLRGEEFNSVVENSPRLAQALADGLNVPIGRLRKMAEEGRLTADVVVNALLSQKDKLAAEYAQMPQTVSQSFERVKNAFAQWISKVDESTGLTKKLAEALTWLAQNLDTVMLWLKRIAEVGLAILIYRLIPALITAWQTAGAAAVTAAASTSAAWATANRSVSGAIASAGALKTAFAVLGSFLIGWEIGTWLSEKFEIVRKAGIFMVEVLMKGIENLRFQWEVFAAIFTTDTISEAIKRHQARLAEMNQIFKEMYAEAEKGSNAAKNAMNTSASAAEEIAKRLEAVRQGTQEAVGRGLEAVHAAIEKLKSRIGEVEQAITQANQTINDATAKMADAYKGLTANVEASLQRQVDAVKARYQQEQTALELSSQSQATLITKSTALLTEALTQQTTLRQQATIATLKLIDDESKARIEAARRDGQNENERAANVKRVENEILATKRQTLTQAAADYRQHIDALNAEANRHLTEIKRIEEEKRQLAMSTEERIREIKRQGMSDFEATEDRKRQIVELQTKAREALANGEFENAKQLAQKAMELAAQVASNQTNEAKRGEEARKQSEQAVSQITQLEAQSREAYRKQEYAQAEELAKQAAQLRAETAQKAKEADAQIAQGKDGVNQAIQRIRDSEEILKQSLDGEAKAHQQAAQSALSARDQIKQTLAQTEAQIDQLTAKLQQGLKITLEADRSRFDQAIADLDKAMAEKQVLVSIQADLQQAEKKLQEYEILLKEGKTLPVDADFSKAKAALDQLKDYATKNTELELKVATEKAQASITNVESQIKALDRIQTESKHQVSTNAEAAKSEIQSLNGMNTSSTHVIHIQKVEDNATGGLVGSGVRHFADGGAVAPDFPRMSGGSVPGSGNQDTVPRTLDAGAFVLKKAAVQKYGSLVRAFASGGSVEAEKASPAQLAKTRIETEIKKRELEVEVARAELEKMKADLVVYPQTYHGKTEREYYAFWRGYEKLKESIPVKEAAVKGLEVDAAEYKLRHVGQFAGGGQALAASDTVLAMLTPGEYVVNKSTVARFGVGFFEAINQMALPAQSLARRVRGYASGGLVSSLAGTAARATQVAKRLSGADLGALALDSLASSIALPKPAFASEATPSRTIRVELAAGERKVAATVDARDESRLLELLKEAQSRAL